ncbi:MAG TPA: hypothetical protein VLQ79_04460 [Myxococcaceae bacterium]|nr:hypothetical protein [Myxococcaceae bacterium]
MALLVAAPVVLHLARGSIAYLGLLEDDYFYYAIVADKLLTLGKLTYDGTTVTNGFHPLWFLTVLVLRGLAGGLNTVFYGLLTTMFLVSMVATYELSRLFARALGASAVVAAAVPLVHSVATNLVVASGMESALDVPLLLWFLLELTRMRPVTTTRAARLGFIASLAILSRLDIALVVLLVLLGWLWFARPPRRTLVPALLAFCAAGAAVPLYAAWNLVLFGSVLPVSGQAKQLVVVPGLNLSYLKIVARHTVFGPTAGITLVCGVAALLVLWRRRARGGEGLRADALFAAAVILGFTALFYGLNALSGWTYFGWYAYPLGAALVASYVLIGTAVTQWIPAAWRPGAAATVVALSTVLALAAGIRAFAIRGPLWKVEDNGLLAMSVELADRMRDRTGVFAMGAIGGFATYLLQKPVVQLEGLVADRAMVEHVRQQRELGAVLREYRVDYLIVSLHRAVLEQEDGCYRIMQPNAEWSGERVARMGGHLCTEPVAHFWTRLPVRPWSSFSTLETYVFDVRGARWRERSQ